MRVIKYKFHPETKVGLLITKCKQYKSAKVGSVFCQNCCNDNQGTDKTNQTVNCSYNRRVKPCPDNSK